ncbi:Uncharacterized protein TCM_033757 [Theobroma cacao]|uniref:Uncharacterized protein n=1 Tax=Theobroma cacao TaxID=3641 RepID=A0A061FAI3_THECC|nr:Uncharacterized protein TCM_033757 [Theobroma cacao]
MIWKPIKHSYPEMLYFMSPFFLFKRANHHLNLCILLLMILVFYIVILCPLLIFLLILVILLLFKILPPVFLLIFQHLFPPIQQLILNLKPTMTLSLLILFQTVTLKFLLQIKILLLGKVLESLNDPNTLKLMIVNYLLMLTVSQTIPSPNTYHHSNSHIPIKPLPPS